MPITRPHSPDLHFSKIHWPGAQKQEVTRPMQVINKMLNRMGAPLWLVPRFDYREDMVSMEQVVNFQHLIARVLEASVPGDIVEFGCYTGSTTAIIGTVLREAASLRDFHVYDTFQHNLGREKMNVLRTFVENMKREGLELPYIHRGDLLQTLPDELPAAIAFAHFDLGVGGDPNGHKKCLLHCLEEVYDRMPSGAVGVLMDYHEEGITIQGANVNPGVKLACDEFFTGRPERVYTLYGGPCSHGYFRKA
jgi:O-methyltransferase